MNCFCNDVHLCEYSLFLVYNVGMHYDFDYNSILIIRDSTTSTICSCSEHFVILCGLLLHTFYNSSKKIYIYVYCVKSIEQWILTINPHLSITNIHNHKKLCTQPPCAYYRNMWYVLFYTNVAQLDWKFEVHQHLCFLNHKGYAIHWP